MDKNKSVFGKKCEIILGDENLIDINYIKNCKMANKGMLHEEV